MRCAFLVVVVLAACSGRPVKEECLEDQPADSGIYDACGQPLVSYPVEELGYEFARPVTLCEPALSDGSCEAACGERDEVEDRLAEVFADQGGCVIDPPGPAHIAEVCMFEPPDPATQGECCYLGVVYTNCSAD